MPTPQLQTRRLLLRAPALEDFESWAALHQDSEVTRYIGGLQPRAMVFRGLLAMAGAWSLQGFGMFSVIERASGRWIGRVGPWCPEGWPGTEVGWSLLRDAWGHGYALEAAVASIDWAFANLPWDEVIHTIDPANQASQNLALRLGSQRRGPGRLPPPFEDAKVEIWGQTKSQWQDSRAKLEGVIG